jgi:lambda repressor-like predicted transcriptional regulator
MTTTDHTPETTTTDEAKAAEIRTGAAAVGIPTRATWKQHGNPIKGWLYYGAATAAPDDKGREVYNVKTDPQGITLKGGNGRDIAGMGVASKFWALVPETATFKAAETPKPKASTEPAGKVEITAPKGGDQTVAPRKGAIAKAIKATGQSIQAISRKHGLNPSQMRRLAADTVAKVDLARAEVIAKALGAKMADLFEAPVDKAKANGTAPAPATETPKPRRSTSKTAKAERARQARQEASEAAHAADEERFGPQADEDAKVEAEAAAEAAEGSQDTTPAE